MPLRLPDLSRDAESIITIRPSHKVGKFILVPDAYTTKGAVQHSMEENLVGKITRRCVSRIRISYGLAGGGFDSPSGSTATRKPTADSSAINVTSLGLPLEETTLYNAVRFKPALRAVAATPRALINCFNDLMKT